MPQDAKFLFHRPGPSHFQIHGPESLKTLSLGFWQVFFRIQPEVFGSFQFWSPSLSNFLFSNSIYGLPHMSHDGKAVGQRGSSRKLRGNAREWIERTAPPYPSTPPGSPPFAPGRAWHKTSSASRSSVLPYIFDCSLPKVADPRHTLRSLGDRLLVDPDLPKGLFLLPSQSPRNGPLLDSPGFGPGHQHLADSVSRTGDAGNPGVKESEELAAVQVS